MLQKILRFKWEALFLLVVCILSWYYSYHEILFFHPSSMDIWRQSDCTSIAFNYYQNDMNFFLPKLHHCLNQEGYAAGECPLIYYFVAILYKIFGVNEYLFRLTNLVIFVFGLLALYKITLIILGDRFYAFFIPLLLFSCPLIAFYANNFLTDVPSLSFTFMAWLQILKYKKDQKRSNFIWSMIFFALAILLKANSAISFIALAAIAFIELNNWNEFNIDKKIFNRILLTIIGFTSVLIVVYAWYKWTIVFNEEHRTDYFAKQAWPWWPIWALSDEDLVKTVVSIFYNFNDLFNIFTTAIFFFSLVFILLNRRYLSHFLLAIFVLLLTGSIMFFSYFFVGFKNQVYYYINLMILPVFSFICTLYILKERYGKVYAS
ncbi:MAG TPA: glycosyltransferase family 39 protein, partial [Bacteroidia bacterium]|nr:glycosyltransferase family 39 protein [Bacteroidia bacterium]